ncbi:MAG: hypothetical protein HS127_09145 [Planctomycetia bacterium]|uniref:hypothetical protein n=1 Tax=Candidatus Kuenenia sp. TaxID=2499824 RepID=UPI001D655543|nr:hypothetical protein [Planctomycetia bacterium]TVL98984.1 MAG: hypothetical protein CV080_08525 [Candidatus Kuenenia stuttgartiensis]
MAKKTKKTDLADTLTKVKECLSLLPDKDEWQRILQIIQEIIQELEVLRESIGRFPDKSESLHVSNSIHSLVSFFDTLKENPLLAEMIFPRKAKSRKTKSSPIDVNALQQHLEGIPTEKILEELTKYKKDILIELSAKMNITANKKLTKDALADRLFKLGFANKRGYELLRKA